MTFGQVLAALTTAPAERFGDSGRLGRIAKGFLGDLAVVEGDSSSDIRSPATVRYVIREGRIGVWSALIVSFARRGAYGPVLTNQLGLETADPARSRANCYPQSGLTGSTRPERTRPIIKVRGFDFPYRPRTGTAV